VGAAAGGVDLGARPLLSLARADLGDPLGQRNLELVRRPRAVVEIRERDARQPCVDGLLDRAEVGFFLWRHERERLPDRLGAAGSADAMDVVLRSTGNLPSLNPASAAVRCDWDRLP
jgi:hypothetical protein